MAIKDIFKNGMEEFKRRNALRKEKRALKRKQKIYSKQLTDLGKKAWEANVDMNQYGSLEKLISTTQGQWDSLNSQKNELEKQKLETEEKKKQQDKAFDDKRKAVEAKKSGVDATLNDEKKVLKEAQKESERAGNRVNQIIKEDQILTKRLADPQTTPEDKKVARLKIEGLAQEKEKLDLKVTETAEAISAATTRIAPIEEESAFYQKEINDIRTEQKSAITELDNAISDFNRQISECDKKAQDVKSEQNSNFHQLGEQLAGTDVQNEALTDEMSTVQATENEMSAFKLQIETLEARATPESKSAMQQLFLIIGGGLLVLVALIFILIWLLGPKKEGLEIPVNPADAIKKTTTPTIVPTPPFSNTPTAKNTPKPQGTPPHGTTPKGTSPQNMQDIMKQMNKQTGALKDQADKMYGKTIVISDQATLSAVLPQVNGWKMSAPRYSAQKFGQLEGANVSADYLGADGKRVQITVTDAGHASAILRPYSMIFSMGLTRDDARRYEKVTKYNGIPVIEKYDKRNNRARFTFIIKNRYLALLKTKGEGGIELLKHFMSMMNFSGLQ